MKFFKIISIPMTQFLVRDKIHHEYIIILYLKYENSYYLLYKCKFLIVYILIIKSLSINNT